MTVKELIQRLAQYPPELRVVVQGYETGFNNITTLQQVPLRENPDAAWYDGEYDADESGGEPAVLLLGKPRVAG